MEKILQDIVKKIKARLKENGMTQEQFSIKMGKGSKWFTALPHVQGDIKVGDLLKACRILKIEASKLLSSNFSYNICEMSIEDLIKILVKRECDVYLEKKIPRITHLLEHIRNEEDA